MVKRAYIIDRLIHAGWTMADAERIHAAALAGDHRACPMPRWEENTPEYRAWLADHPERSAPARKTHQTAQDAIWDAWAVLDDIEAEIAPESPALAAAVILRVLAAQPPIRWRAGGGMRLRRFLAGRELGAVTDRELAPAVSGESSPAEMPVNLFSEFFT